MAISTLQSSQNTSSSGILKFVTLALIVLGFVVLGFLGFNFLSKLLSFGGVSGLRVELLYGDGEATVFLDGQEIGKTPLTVDDIKPGEHKVSVRNDTQAYEVTLTFLPGYEVVIRRDLGVSQMFSGGQDLWVEKESGGTKLTVISEPGAANVLIDGSSVGTTAFSSSELVEGTYDLRIEADGYEPQQTSVDIFSENKVNVSTTLVPLPVPARISPLQGSTNMYNVSVGSISVTSNTSEWAKAVVYWNKTRGLNIEGAGITKSPFFDFFVDYAGKIFDAEGTLVPPEQYSRLSRVERGAYLRRSSDSETLTAEAEAALVALEEAIAKGGSASAEEGDETTPTTPSLVTSGQKMATILDTGLGWLRVRSEPSLAGSEVTTVDVGTKHVVLEEQAEWVKIRVNATTEGWVSSTYVSIAGGEDSETAPAQ